jgi:AcrR family transcriptional regulator
MAQDARLPATRRSLAKQQTRLSLLAAAKTLISERGYDAATLRDVAALARVSTGAVFANFNDKADLFNEVIIADLAVMLDQMRSLASVEEAPRDGLVRLLMVGYAARLDGLSLIQAQLAFSWSSHRAAEQRRASALRPILALLADVLRDAIRSGVLAASLDAELLAEMAWDCYVANYRNAIFDGWKIDALHRRLCRQIDILLEGYRVAARRDTAPSWMVSGLKSEPPSPARPEPWEPDRRTVARG